MEENVKINSQIAYFHRDYMELTKMLFKSKAYFNK